MSVSEVACKRVRAAFQRFEDAFDGVAIPVGDMLESEAEVVTGRLQPRRTIDQKDRVAHEMFFVEFFEEHLGQCGGSGRKQSDVQQAVRRGVDRRVQPVALVVDLNHGLVNRAVIQVFTGWGR